VFSRIEKKNEYKEIPGVIFSTSNHPIDKERTIAKGAKVFLAKPAEFLVLKNILHAILKTNFNPSELYFLILC